MIGLGITENDVDFITMARFVGISRYGIVCGQKHMVLKPLNVIHIERRIDLGRRRQLGLDVAFWCELNNLARITACDQLLSSRRPIYCCDARARQRCTPAALG